ncbi:hypothetical protein HNY73_007840 [Argiope bruennichi]|uniref:Uncharacterized protein n=1 Tax=Argiope bruennichi TaxID=94029 RepID=A0A8T0F756_ARGBR|nr:hypothetical protein HNY73_007840 [Argiope bruennichi]
MLSDPLKCSPDRGDSIPKAGAKNRPEKGPLPGPFCLPAALITPGGSQIEEKVLASLGWICKAMASGKPVRPFIF